MQGVPNWARHVRPADVEVDASTDELARQLLDELAVPVLLDGHLAPEQIALVGVREIAAGHQVDGALWLAIGSYRYHQETREAVIRGRRRLRYAADQRARERLRGAGATRRSIAIARLASSRELVALDARVYGRGEAEKALQEQLTALGKTTPIERESLRDALWELRPSAAAVEGSRYPRLVEAFHQPPGRRLPRRRARRAPGDLPRADADRVAAGRRGSVDAQLLRALGLRLGRRSVPVAAPGDGGRAGVVAAADARQRGGGPGDGAVGRDPHRAGSRAWPSSRTRA